MIVIRGLDVRREGRSICRVERFDLAPRSRLLVRGVNGSGKSTFLRALAGLEESFAGVIDGLPRPSKRVLVHQEPFFFRGDVRRNVSLGLTARRFSAVERLERTRDALEEFGLTGLADRRVSVLSGGERRRVALSRAFILDPELILLDEPFADLDSSGREVLEHALARRPEMTVVIASPVELDPLYLHDAVLDLSDPSES